MSQQSVCESIFYRHTWQRYHLAMQQQILIRITCIFFEQGSSGIYSIFYWGYWHIFILVNLTAGSLKLKPEDLFGLPGYISSNKWREKKTSTNSLLNTTLGGNTGYMLLFDSADFKSVWSNVSFHTAGCHNSNKIKTSILGFCLSAI